MVAGLIVNKFIALFIGPSGLALIGTFQNVSTLIQTAAQGGINSGVTKYTAEYHAKGNTRNELWGSSLRLTLIFTVLTSIIMFLFAEKLSLYVFGNTEYLYVFNIFSITLIFYSVNQLMLSILNGLKQIREFIFINITQSLFSLFYTSILIFLFHLNGALIALVTNQSVVFFVTLWRFKINKSLLINQFIIKWNKLHVKKLINYSFMALVTATCLPLSQVFVRNYIAEHLSWDFAGYWQAMTYISTVYLTVVTVALSTYYLPRLSEIDNKKDLRIELKKGYGIILPVVSILALVVFLAKDLAVWVLFSPDFKPMLTLFKWQLIGDVLKIAGWLLAYLMLAKAMVKKFIITEILFSVSFTSLSVIFLKSFGFIGLSYAFALNYFIYLIVMICVMRKTVF